jgi:outer membrane protein TolC
MRARTAVLAQFPKISIGFRGGRDTSDSQTVGFGATIDIPFFDHNQNVISTEKATRQKLFDEYTGRVFAARSDIATAIVNITTLNDQLEAARRSLPALENLVRTYQQAEKRGDVDALSLYSAQSTLLQKRIAVAKLTQQLMQNWVALEIAAGRCLPRGAATQPATAPSTEGRK